MGNRETDALHQGMDGAGNGELPVDFQDALRKFASKGSVCALSRVAQAVGGQVTCVEWGVTSPWLDDWVAGPRIASANEVVRAVAAGAAVCTLFPTATGFACGPELVLGRSGELELAPEGPEEWSMWMLPRLNLARAKD